MGLCGRRWTASPAPGPLVLALGFCLDYKSLSKEQTGPCGQDIFTFFIFMLRTGSWHNCTICYQFLVPKAIALFLSSGHKRSRTYGNKMFRPQTVVPKLFRLYFSTLVVSTAPARIVPPPTHTLLVSPNISSTPIPFLVLVIINPPLFGEFMYAYVCCYNVRVQFECHLSNKVAVNGSLLWWDLGTTFPRSQVPVVSYFHFGVPSLNNSDSYSIKTIWQKKNRKICRHAERVKDSTI